MPPGVFHRQLKSMVREVLDLIEREHYEEAAQVCKTYLYGAPKKMPDLAKRSRLKRDTRMPSIDQIVKAQKFLWSELGVEYPAIQCWVCKAAQARPVMAHVKAAIHGGTNDPGNFFLLCQNCHEAQPDGADESIQLQWIRMGGWSPDWRAEFLRLTGITIEDLTKLLMERYGNREAEPMIRDVMQRGRSFAAGHGKLNSTSNMLAELARFALEEVRKRDSARV